MRGAEAILERPDGKRIQFAPYPTALKNAEGKVPADLRSQVEQAIAELKTTMQGENIESIRQGAERLGQASMRLGETLHRGSAGADAAGPSGQAQGESDVIDAEFEEHDQRDRRAS